MGGVPSHLLHGQKKDFHIDLESPTSIQMKNSFIIKNADPSFDTYYKQMTKRKALLNISVPVSGFNGSPVNQGTAALNQSLGQVGVDT